SGTVREAMLTPKPSRRETVVRAVWIIVDGLCWALAIVATMFTRLQLETQVLEVGSTWSLALGAAGVHAAVGVSIGPYMVRHVRGSFEEVTSVARTAFITGLILVGVAWLIGSAHLPRSISFLATGLAIVLMLANRFTVRTYRSHRAGNRRRDRRVIVYGA